MNWLRNFMYGRNGSDQLTIAFIVVGLLVSVIVSFFHISYLGMIAYIPYGYCVFRMLSRNIPKRRQENAMFLGWWNPIARSVMNQFNRLKDKDHKYFNCPTCNATLRVPKGKGKITVTCPKCKKEITKKT